MIKLRVAATALCVLVACGGSAERPAAAPCPAPTPATGSIRLPGGFPAGKWGTVTQLEERAGFTGAEVISTTQIVELYPDIVRTLTERGYVLLGGDNEGFEAEISFTDPKDNYVNLILRQGCDDQVKIRILIEKEARL